MNSRTKAHLQTAMECDAVDAVTYQRFAGRARLEGDWDLARAFQEAADADRSDHFAKELELQNAVADTPENLRKAIEAEKSEIEMFARFAGEAAEDGDRSAAALFQKIHKDKADNCAKFDAVLAEIGVHSNYETITQ